MNTLVYHRVMSRCQDMVYTKVERTLYTLIGTNVIFKSHDTVFQTVYRDVKRANCINKLIQDLKTQTQNESIS